MVWRFWVLGVVAMMAIGCGGDDDRVCDPGGYLGCTCPSGGMGFMQCNAAGSGFGFCECVVDDGGTPMSDAGSSGCDVTLVPEGYFVDTCSGLDMCRCTIAACDSPPCSICDGAGTCEPALPRRVRITPVLAQVPTTNSAGEAWDVGGGAPDLYATVTVDGAVALARTATGMDSFGVEWTGASGDANVVSGSQITVDVLDADDLDADDPAFNCTFPVTPELLRFRVLVCEDESIGAFVGTVLPL